MLHRLQKLGIRLALPAVAVACVACQQQRGAHPAGSGAAAQPSGYDSSASAVPSESEKTRIMQEKADDIERRLAEIQEQRQSGAITEDEAMNAIAQLDAERREVMRMGEGDPPPQ